jgi:hypothetical protein
MTPLMTDPEQKGMILKRYTKGRNTLRLRLRFSEGCYKDERTTKPQKALTNKYNRILKQRGNNIHKYAQALKNKRG